MPKVFISYSHKDETWKNRLQTQLNVLEMEGLLSVWEDRQITLGDSWNPEIENALNQAEVAILLISADFLVSKFIRGKEIPLLLTRREQEGIRVIPLILKPCPWRKVGWLSALQGASRDNVELSGLTEHQQDECLCKLAEKVSDLLNQLIATTQNHIDSQLPSIHSDRLPTVKGEFFGRVAELKMLNDAWAGNGIRIIQFIAPGGTGKTKLLRHWLDHTAGIDALIAWSFYSQGASEDKQISATPFFSHVFGMLKSDKIQFNTEEEKGEHLAHLLRQRRCLLVLDGLEPLQQAGRGMPGELKDRAIRQLLKSLAGEYNSLCIITTRLAVHELCDRAHTISHDLQNLAPQDGVSLLKFWGVHGSETELEKAVHEYSCHALALHLLGNALHTYLDGDVRKRDTLSELIDDYDDAGRHAFKVMQAYGHWLTGTPDLQLLHLLGLFDHPIETGVLQVLWQAQIPNLTAGIPEQAWKVAIRDLREKHRILSAHEGHPNLLDCHPLIREYFGGQLQSQQPQAWQQAHERLYVYYKALPEKEFPDTLEEMQPLFSAVAHGCAAGFYQQAFYEVYWSRIKRNDDHFLTRMLCGIGDELAILKHFFVTPWEVPIENLGESERAGILNLVGYSLTALGRLDEALEPNRQCLEILVKQKNWPEATNHAMNFCELQVNRGYLDTSEGIAKQAVVFGDNSGDWFWRMASQANYANVLHLLGHATKARELFLEAESVQRSNPNIHPYLYSLQGFNFCKLLLAQGEVEDVLKRVEQTLEWVTNAKQDTLSVVLDQVSVGCAYLLQYKLFPPLGGKVKVKGQHAYFWLEKAVEDLRKQSLNYLSHGLLVRACLFRHIREYSRAHYDLQEVREIADFSRMRLHLTDYHLEMARLLLAEAGINTLTTGFGPIQPVSSAQSTDLMQPGIDGMTRCLSEDEVNFAQVQTHVTQAAELIAATGYHRRDAELAELQACLRNTPK